MIQGPETQLRWIPAVAYAGVLFFLSSRPALGAGPWFPGADKIIHASAYAILSALVQWALEAMRPGPPPAPLRRRLGVSVVAAGLAAVYGITDEYHQSFVPGRMADVWDVVADATGAVAGVVLVRIWEAKRGRGAGQH